MKELMNFALKNKIREWILEDELDLNLSYLQSLPSAPVKLELRIKSDLVLGGTHFFSSVFETLGAAELSDEFQSLEGKFFRKGQVIQLEERIPFGIALTGERVALNILQRVSAIATVTKMFVDKASPFGIEILDTRKTTPGLRSIEKYATRLGGAANHRFSQTDVFMIKDNHKNFFGGIKGSVAYFKSLKNYYQSLVVEIHHLDELEEAIELGCQNLMLDNFTPTDIQSALKFKMPGLRYELSGGITIDNLDAYLIKGVDAISTSAITSHPPKVDLSLKYYP